MQRQLFKKFKYKNNLIGNRILIVLILLTVLGLVAIADVSAPLAQRQFSDKFYFVKQQVLWAFIGIILLFVFSKVHYLFWEKIAVPLFFLSLVTLVLVLLPGLGKELLGAKRWIFLGDFSIQPSEFLKISLASFLAKISYKKKKIYAFFPPIVISAFLIMLQPDLGTTILIVGMSLIQLFIAGVSKKLITFSLILGTFLSIILILISPYRRDRLLGFVETIKNPLGGSYHIRQILLALGSGGFLGVGLGQSRQKHLFLPETATDSIFAIVAEETGFIGSIVLICLYLYFILICVDVVKNSRDQFSKVLSAGIVSALGLQTILNLGSMVALVPLTGVPLPFISYGGSSLITLMLGCGILLSIDRYSKNV